MLEYENTSNKRIKKSKIVLIVAISLVATIISIIALIVPLRAFYHNRIAEGTSKEYIDIDFTEVCDELDYSGIIATAQHYCDIVDSAYLVDADKDGRKELFLSTCNELYGPQTNILAFDTADHAIMSSAIDYGAAGITYLTKTKKYPLSLTWGYGSSGVSYSYYEKWTDKGWVKYAHIDGGEEAQGEEYKYRLKSAEIEGESITSFEEFNKRIETETVDLYPTMTPDCLKTNYFPTNNAESVLLGYENHLKDYNYNYTKIFKDIDGDKNKESVFIIDDFGRLWANNLQTVGTGGNLMEEFIGKLDNTGTVLICADTNDAGVVFHAFFLEKQPNLDNLIINWDDCILNISDNYSDIDLHFFCAQIDLVLTNYENNAITKKIFSKYITYMTDGYTNLHYRYADICSIPGDELICVSDSNEVELRVYAIYLGRVICIYTPTKSSNGAVFITKKDNNFVLMRYDQHYSVYGYNYSNVYEYEIFIFDKNYCEKVITKSSITVNSDSKNTSKYDSFFDDLNKYLENATVCYDNYQLTGYSIMQDSSENTQSNSKYLSISNCSTNKKGVVRVNSWLNFRKNPSIKSKRILIDPNDSESFIKQVNGSSVTVIDVANTKDKKYPIWLKIKIKYSDRELVGYSSQKYIDIDGIKQLTVGKEFVIKADTNDNNLVWKSSDETILSVDQKSGKAVAHKKGMVLVSVTSASGLTDSCLIKVNK